MIFREVIAGLRYRRALTLSLVAGIALSTAIIVGSTIAGDSVKASLQQLAQARIGKAQFALLTNDRFVSDDLGEHVNGADSTPLILLPGNCAFPAEQTRAPAVQVIGVDDRFWELANRPVEDFRLGPREAAINRPLANLLGIPLIQEESDGESFGTVVVRVEQPSAIPRDAPLADDANLSIALRSSVVRILGPQEGGRFSIQNHHVAPPTIYVPLSTLQRELEEAGRANVLLFSNTRTPHAINGRALLKELTNSLTANDLGLTQTVTETKDEHEWRSRRIFFHERVETRLREAPSAYPVLTYFVNELRLGDRLTPHSMVTAHPKLGAGLAANEIRINDWLAEDLQAKPGDTIELTYFVAGDRRELTEVSTNVVVKEVVALEGGYADRTLLPDFPGISDAANCSDWDPSFPLDLDLIRDKDETYWDDHRGTPKAFVSYETGKRLWGNRWGDATAIRFGKKWASVDSLQGAHTRLAIPPNELGMQWTHLRDEANSAVTQSMDFGGLFIGFGFFLIGAALLLTAILFAFSIEQRQGEIGLWRAVGARPRRVYARYLKEGLLLASLGALVGIPLGIGYSSGLIYGMNSVWRGALNDLPLSLHIHAGSVVGAALGGLIVAGLTLALMLRKRLRVPIVSLLKGARTLANLSSKRRRIRHRRSVFFGGLCLGGALLVAPSEGTSAAITQGFFTVGLLVLAGGLFFARATLLRPTPRAALDSLTALALRNQAARPGRSLASITLVALGTFMLISVSAYRQDGHADSNKPESGTGGFALHLRLTQPLLRDLNVPVNREFYGLDETLYDQVSFVPFRVRSGDEASCLNLNRAQQPLVAGVRPADLDGRFTFTHGSGWEVLNENGAVMDMNAMMWALGKQPGDMLEVNTDIGNAPLALNGALANSLLQGVVVVSETHFQTLYPDESGYRLLLVDAPEEMIETLAADLRTAFVDHGIEVEHAADRLNTFNEVQNTYLAIFQSLAGLALLLGSVGLGLVLARNIFERRGELAVMTAAGYTHDRIRRLVLQEHIGLLLKGLGIGMGASAIALAPSFRVGGDSVPWFSLVCVLLLITANGFGWILGATGIALRGNLIQSLRAE